MPRYNYYCSLCDEISVYRLGINELPDACILCHSTGSLSKTFNNSTFVSNSNTAQVESKVGDLTKKYIEDNRKILDEQIKEAKKEEYEPS